MKIKCFSNRILKIKCAPVMCIRSSMMTAAGIMTKMATIISSESHKTE